MARVLLLSPYHGGSHRAFAEGLASRSRHAITLLTLPARFWKWRMRGAALLLAARARRLPGPWDLVLATDMLNLAEFRGLWGGGQLPHVLYFHENQLDYPLPEHDTLDLHYGFINLASARAADAVIFNSRTHRDAFFAAAPRLLAAMPDCPLPGLLAALKSRTRVLPVGCELQELRRTPRLPAGGDEPPLILWNHRWEFDKAPELFARTLHRLHDRGVPFRLIVAGEPGDNPSPSIATLPEEFPDETVHFGFAPSKEEYGRLLWRSDIVISTTRHEFFGVGMVEAMAAGCVPCVPNRYNYPALVPRELHGRLLWGDEADLTAKLEDLLTSPLPERDSFRTSAKRYSWDRVALAWDAALDDLVSRRSAG
jgi:glycosyltransferase involved in cell wall biosynthesis